MSELSANALAVFKYLYERKPREISKFKMATDLDMSMEDLEKVLELEAFVPTSIEAKRFVTSDTGELLFQMKLLKRWLDEKTVREG